MKSIINKNQNERQRAANKPPGREKKMYKIIWIWNDGTQGAYIVETKQQAEMLTRQLYFNPDIVKVFYGDF